MPIMESDLMIIRNATAGDVDALAAMIAAVRLQTYETLIPAEKLTEFKAEIKNGRAQRRKWRSRIEQSSEYPSRSVTRLLQHHDRIVGFYRYTHAETGYFITNFYIATDAQGKGYGGRLMRDLFRIIENQPISLDVLAENVAAIAFYEKMGFHDDGPASGAYFGAAKRLMKTVVTD